MELIYLNEKLDSSVERELNAPEESLGFEVTLKLKARPEFGIGVRTEVMHNVTEVHYLYESLFEKRIAFESTLHCNGGTYAVDTIDSVSLVLSTKKYRRM